MKIPKSHPPTNPLTASFSTEDGFQKSGLESRKRRSLREKDDFGIKFKRAGYPNLKINQNEMKATRSLMKKKFLNHKKFLIL